MAKQATGELRPLADGWAARITIVGRTRQDFVLATVANEAEAEERCKAMAQIASRLRRAGKVKEIVPTLEMAAKARAGRAWEAVLVYVSAECAGQMRDVGAKEMPTLADVFDDWTSGKLYTKHPDHVRKQKERSAERYESIGRTYIKPTIGTLRIDEVSLGACELVMASVPADREPATRTRIAQCLRTLLNYCVYPLRHITANPVPKGWVPKVGKPKGLQWVRPDEDAKHLAHVELPIERRLFLGISRREGFRKEELAELRWRDVDLERGGVRLDVNKTDDARAWALSPDVAEALRRWKATYRKDAEAGDRVFIDPASGGRLNVDRLSEQQRADLLAAGIDRHELHHDGPNRRKLRAHDSRASFTTEALARGKSEAWVMDRTGWTTSIMLNKYRRAARTWGELNLGTWTPLYEAIPELAAAAPSFPVRCGENRQAPIAPALPQASSGGTISGTLGSRSAAKSPRSRKMPRGDSPFKPAASAIPPRGQSDLRGIRGAIDEGEGSSDPVEAALAKALGEASAAGRWDVVAKLAGELEARRRARASVPSIEEARERRRK